MQIKENMFKKRKKKKTLTFQIFVGEISHQCEIHGLKFITSCIFNNTYSTK